MKRGLILTNAYADLPSFVYQSERLKEELEALGIPTDIRRNDGFFARVEKDSIAEVLGEYAFCVYLDKDKYVSEALERTGMRLFNSHEAVRVCDDKMETYLRLAGKGVPLVKTLAGLLCFMPEAPVKEETARRIESELGYPVIVKESYGSLGKNVYMARDRAELVNVMESVKCCPHLFQQAVQTSFGRDVRVIVVGGKVFAAMLRRSEKDFRSNIELGGRGEPFALTSEMREVCERAASALGLDYCGIDLLFGEEEKPLICEVNSNAFFGGIERATGKNVARAYAEHIRKETGI